MAVSINLGMGAMPGTYAAVAPGPVPLVSVPDVTRPPSRPFTPIAPLAPIGPEFGTDRATAIRERMARRPAPAAGPASVAQAAPAAEPDAPRAEAPVPRSPGGLGGLGGLSFGDHISALGMSLMTGGGGNYLGNYPQALENIRQRRREEAQMLRAEEDRRRQLFEAGMQRRATAAYLMDGSAGLTPEEAQIYQYAPDIGQRLIDRRRAMAEREALRGVFGAGAPAPSPASVPPVDSTPTATSTTAPSADGTPPPLGARILGPGAPAESVPAEPVPAVPAPADVSSPANPALATRSEVGENLDALYAERDRLASALTDPNRRWSETSVATLERAIGELDTRIERTLNAETRAREVSEKQSSDEQSLRKEFQSLPSYKNFQQVVSIYDSMVDARDRDTAAADINLVFGLGKLFDPTSVVRESEQDSVRSTAAWPDWLVGSLARIEGGGSLRPATRRAILDEAYSRARIYRELLAEEGEYYRGVAERNGLDVEDSVPPIAEIAPPPPLPGEPPPPPPLSPDVEDMLNGAGVD